MDTSASPDTQPQPSATPSPATASDPVHDDAVAALVGKMHLLLSATAMITAIIVPAVQAGFSAAWLLFFGYTVHSIVLYLLFHLRLPGIYSHVVNRLDVCWYALMDMVAHWGESHLAQRLFISEHTLRNHLAPAA